MKLFSKVAAVAAVTTLAVGGGATAASAYSISGGAYTSVPTSTPSLTVGGAYGFLCSAWSISGSATGAATSGFTSAVSGCSFFGVPLTVAQSGNWNLEVTGGGGSSYTGEVEIPAGSTMTWDGPLMGCTFTITGPQTFRHGVGANVVEMENVGAGVELTLYWENVVYAASGCPFGSGSDGILDSGGVIEIPGITIS